MLQELVFSSRANGLKSLSLILLCSSREMLHILNPGLLPMAKFDLPFSLGPHPRNLLLHYTSPHASSVHELKEFYHYELSVEADNAHWLTTVIMCRSTMQDRWYHHESSQRQHTYKTCHPSLETVHYV